MPNPQTEIVVIKDGAELVRRVVVAGEYLFGRGSDVDFRIDTPMAVGDEVARGGMGAILNARDAAIVRSVAKRMLASRPHFF